MIGYFGWDAYRIYDPKNHQIYHSCDIIFEEGANNKTLPAPSNEGENAVVSTIPDRPLPKANNEQNKGLALTDKLAVPTLPTSELPPCCSTHVIIPTQAIRDSCLSEQAIQNAHSTREAWANDQIHAIDNHEAKAFHTNAEALPHPHNYWLPNSYNDAMMRPNIWEGPIQKELAVMKKHGVWTMVDPPEGARLVKTRWTFVNKYNMDGNLSACKARLVAKGFT